MEEGGGFQQMISNIEFLTLEDDSDDRDMHKVPAKIRLRGHTRSNRPCSTHFYWKSLEVSGQHYARETIAQSSTSMEKKARKLPVGGFDVLT
jgi:hypothetical protein